MRSAKLKRTAVTFMHIEMMRGCFSEVNEAWSFCMLQGMTVRDGHSARTFFTGWVATMRKVIREVRVRGDGHCPRGN